MVAGSRSGSGDAEQYGARAAAAEVSGRELRTQLTFPADWGPTEWVRRLQAPAWRAGCMQSEASSHMMGVCGCPVDSTDTCRHLTPSLHQSKTMYADYLSSWKTPREDNVAACVAACGLI